MRTKSKDILDTINFFKFSYVHLAKQQHDKRIETINDYMQHVYLYAAHNDKLKTLETESDLHRIRNVAQNMINDYVSELGHKRSRKYPIKEILEIFKKIGTKLQNEYGIGNDKQIQLQTNPTIPAN